MRRQEKNEREDDSALSPLACSLAYKVAYIAE